MEWEFCFYRWKQNAASQKDRSEIVTPGPLLSHTWVMVPWTSPGLVDSANASIAILGCKEFMGQMGTKSDVIQMWHWHVLTIYFVTVVYVSCFFRCDWPMSLWQNFILSKGSWMLPGLTYGVFLGWPMVVKRTPRVRRARAQKLKSYSSTLVVMQLLGFMWWSETMSKSWGL